MAAFNIEWDNSPILSAPNVINQRVSYRIPEISNNPGGTSTWTTTGLTPPNPLASSVNSAVFTGLANTLYQVKVESLCEEGGPVIGTNGIQEAVVFACLTPAITPYISDSADGSTQLQYTVSVINTDINKIRVILRKASDNSLAGDQTVTATQLGSTTIAFSSLAPSTAYYAQTTYFAIVNGIEVSSLIPCTSANASTEEPADGNPNLEFSWSKSIGETANLTYDFATQKGFNGSFSQIDWGDGTINTLKTHTYTSNSNFTVRISNSNATHLFLNNSSVDSITKIPSTLVILSASTHLISSLSSLVSSNLQILNLSNGLLDTSIDFTGIPNLKTLNISNNVISGYLDLSDISDLDSITANNNLINSHSPLSQHPSLRYVNFGVNQITSMPNFTSNPLLETINYTSNLISGVLNVGANLNLQYLYFTNNTLTAMPSLTANINLLGVGFGNCTLSGVLNLTGNTSIGNLIVNNNEITNITAFENSSIFTTDISYNKISVSRLNLFLQAVNARNLSGYTFHAEGQIPIAAPTGAGITAKNALISRGYSVTTD